MRVGVSRCESGMMQIHEMKRFPYQINLSGPARETPHHGHG
jgi:hypothetical protein